MLRSIGKQSEESVESVRASSSKPEVHNVLYCGQRRSEPWPRVTCTEKFPKFGHVVVKICEWTDRQTDTHRQTDRQEGTLMAIIRTTLGVK